MESIKWNSVHTVQECVDTHEPHTPVSEQDYSILSIPATPDPWDHREPMRVQESPDQRYSGHVAYPVTLCIADATVPKRERVSLVQALNFDRNSCMPRRLPFPTSQQVFSSNAAPNGVRYQRHVNGHRSYNHTQFMHTNMPPPAPPVESPFQEGLVISGVLLQ